jgi:hypothetical protein
MISVLKSMVYSNHGQFPRDHHTTRKQSTWQYLLKTTRWTMQALKVQSLRDNVAPDR